MKILFINGNLSSGMDGVGDYIRLLAKELLYFKHEVALLSMNEQNSNSLIAEDENFSTILRLPSYMTLKQREFLASEFIKDFCPDMISLQFVVYGWHNKGLPFFFPHMFSRITNGRKVHIMFHELSVGFNVDASLKEKIIGYLQHLIIKSLLKMKNVVSIDTHSCVYKAILESWSERKIGTKPLFGNIPLVKVDEKEINVWCHKYLGIDKSAYFIAGYFGSIGHESLNLALFKKLEAFAFAINKKLLICSAGGIGKVKEKEFDSLKDVFPNVGFVRMGRLDERDVSLYLSTLDVGLAGTPYLLLEKSGSVIAMMEHGLKIISTTDYYHVKFHEKIVFTEFFNSVIHYEDMGTDGGLFVKCEPKSIKRSVVAELVDDFYQV